MFLIPRCVALRKFLTRGALSEECSNMPSFCNFCSSRMSPLPHAHTSGNMWAARCEYVRKLMHPIQFEAKMAILYPGYVNNSCIGTGRYSAEHWIHSHPSARPCDLSNDRFTWSYDNIPTDDLEIKLEPAPRFEFMKYVKEVCQDFPKLENLLHEYKFLYNETLPAVSWWGWKFYNVSAFEVGRVLLK